MTRARHVVAFGLCALAAALKAKLRPLRREERRDLLHAADEFMPGRDDVLRAAGDFADSAQGDNAAARARAADAFLDELRRLDPDLRLDQVAAVEAALAEAGAPGDWRARRDLA